MPRGVKGWPIVSHEGPNRRDLGWAVLIFGVIFPSVFAILAIWFDAKMPFWRFALMVYAMFGGLVVFLVVFMAALGGRLRWTPTTVWWVPLLGPRRCVSFAEVTAARIGPRNCTFRTKSGERRIPMVGGVLGRTNAKTQRHRERIDTWMNEYFAPLTRPARTDWKVLAVKAVALFVVAPLAAVIVFPVAVRVTARFIPRVSSSSQWQQGVVAAAGVLLVFAMIAVFPMAVFAVAKYGFGIAPPKQQTWRLRREQWQGFEVHVPPNVATPPSPL